MKPTDSILKSSLLKSPEDIEVQRKAGLIREKRQLIRNEARLKKSLKNRALIPRSSTKKNLSEMQSHLESLGYDTTSAAARARSQSRGRSSISRGRSTDFGAHDAMDIDDPRDPRLALIARSRSRAKSQSTNRRTDGVTDESTRDKAEKLTKLSQKRMNRMARQGEADRHTAATMPKHLVSIDA